MKQYRPRKKPITANDMVGQHPGLADNFVFKHKRKLLVRDWFFFVVWSMRLKKILSTVYRSDEAGF